MARQDSVMQNFDETKKEKFNEKYQRLAERDWTTDTWMKNLRETMQARDNIEDFITGLQDQLKNYERSQNNNEFDEAIEGFGGEDELDRLESQDLAGGYYPTLGNLRDLHIEEKALIRRMLEWKTLQDELAELALEKVQNVTKTYDEKYRAGRARQDFEKYADSKVEDKVEREMEKMQRERQEEIAALKQLIQATRNETKHHRNHLEKFGKAVIEELSHIGEEVDSINDFQVDNSNLAGVTDNSVELSDFITEDGTVEISREQLEKIKNQAADGNQDEGSDGSEDDGEEDLYKLKGKSLEQKKKVIEKLSDELDVENMSQRDVASETDVTQPTIFGSGQIIDRIEDEYGTRFGL